MKNDQNEREIENEDDGVIYYRRVSSHAERAWSRVKPVLWFKRNIPYPIGFNLEKMEVRWVVNNGRIRSILHPLRKYNRSLKFIFISASFITLIIGSEKVSKVNLAISSILFFLFLIAGLKFTVLAIPDTAETEGSGSKTRITVDS